MNVSVRVKRARSFILAAAVVRVTIVITLAIVATLLVANLAGASNAETRTAVVMTAGPTSLWAYFRIRHALSLQRVVLWLEERNPALQYALAAALDAEAAGEPVSHRLEKIIDAVDTRATLTRAIAVSVLRTAGLAVLIIALVGFVPFDDENSFAVGKTPVSESGKNASVTTLRIRIEPPGYSGLPASITENAAAIEALPGSIITVEGASLGGAPTARLAETELQAFAGDEKWQVRFEMPEATTALHLQSDGEQRVLAVLPIPDSPPQLELSAPARDMVLESARGVVQLGARITDDFGVRRAYFELLLTSGSGEVYTTRTLTLSDKRVENKTEVGLEGALRLEDLALKPGAVLSIRAIAYDGNIGGASRGTSETRTLRMAYAAGDEPLAVAGAPPAPADSAMMSQRMIIIRTEQLQKARPTMPRDTFVARATTIAAMQDRLRLRVNEIISMYLEQSAGGAPSPIVRFLKIAYDAMWQAVREMNIAETETALPPMRRALVALDSARRAERMYLRMRPPRITVDVAKARLQGKERGDDSDRTPGDPADLQRQHIAGRLRQAADLARSDRNASVNLLNTLRVETRQQFPALAEVLGHVVDAVQGGKPIEPALAEARRRLFGQAASTAGLPAWSGQW